METQNTVVVFRLDNSCITFDHYSESYYICNYYSYK